MFLYVYSIGVNKGNYVKQMKTIEVKETSKVYRSIDGSFPDVTKNMLGKVQVNGLSKNTVRQLILLESDRKYANAKLISSIEWDILNLQEQVKVVKEC